MFLINSLIWNPKGASGKDFPSYIKDIMCVYNIDFLAVLETRVSGIRADNIIKKICLQEGARVEAQGFSGGIWCMWRHGCPPISVISSSRYFIHLKVNASSPSFWYFAIVYADPPLGRRLEVWEELRSFKSNFPGPWCLALDFNSVLFEREKVGGGPINQASCDAFSHCIDEYNLIDLGFVGPSFTWNSCSLLERLDRVLHNLAWEELFPEVSVTHLPIQSSDHAGF